MTGQAMTDSLSIAVGTVATSLRSLPEAHLYVDNIAILPLSNTPDSKPTNVIQFTLNGQWYEVTVTEARTPRVPATPAEMHTPSHTPEGAQTPLQKVSLGVRKPRPHSRA